MKMIARHLPPHRPRWKVAINTALRAVQPWPRKWVIYSLFEFAADGGDARLVGYGFGRVKHVPRGRSQLDFFAERQATP